MRGWKAFSLLFLLFLTAGINFVYAQGISNPKGVAVDSFGNRYVADTGNHRIVKIDPSGTATVFAGSGIPGSANGQGAFAQFNSPYKIMFGPSGDLYVADTGNHMIRKITSTGVVSTVTGTGTPGSANGLLSSAQFNNPKGLFVTTLGEIIVADTGNHKIRLIRESANNVLDVAGTGSAGSVSCTTSSCPFDSATNCNAMPLNSPEDIVVTTTDIISGNPDYYYETVISDTGNHGLWALRYEMSNTGTTFACQGKWIGGTGSAGYQVGSATQITAFNSPVAVDAWAYSSGNPNVGTWTSLNPLWIVDGGNHFIRFFTNSPGYAATTPFAGIPQTSGIDDGSAAFYWPGVSPAQTPTAKFNQPSDIFIRANNQFEYSGTYDFYAIDGGNSLLRRLTDTDTASSNGLWSVNSVQINLPSASCTSANDIIFRLSGSTNALGEVYNGAGNYPVNVCYSSLFGQSPPQNPDRICSGGAQETVLKLYAATNAHAEVPEQTNYNNPICYQGLSCRSISSGSCAVNEVEVVRLSSSTNAHLELSGQNNYGTAICCFVSQPSMEFSNLQWRDYANNQIPASNTIPICTGQTVKTFAVAGGITGNVEFDIYENDLINDDFIRTVTGTIGANGNVEANWQIIQADYDTGSNGEIEGGSLEFYFVAKQPSPGTITSPNSYDLQPVVNDPLCNYDSPTGGISGVVHQGTYFINDPIQFSNTCSSPYGPLTYAWTIKQNGNILTIPGGNSQGSFLFTFTQSGQAEISLSCTDIAGQEIRDQIGIVVANSPEILAYIEDPDYWGVEYKAPPASGPYFETELGFSGANSFAVLTFGLGGISNSGILPCVGFCLASSDTANNGECPGLKTINGQKYSQGKIAACQNVAWTYNSINPPGAWSFSYSATPEGNIRILTTNHLNAVLTDLGLTNIPVGHSGLNFDWDFWDNDWTYTGIGYQGNGVTSGFVQYDDMSEQFDDKHIKVKITSVAGSAMQTLLNYLQNPGFNQEFTRDFTLGRCLNGGNEFISNPITHQTQNTLNEDNACNGGDSLPGTADDCCPAGLFCLDGDNDGDSRCETLGGNVITRCEDYSIGNFGSATAAQTACDGNTNPSIPQTSYGQQLGACEYIRCVWDSNSNTCGVQLQQYPANQNGNGQCISNPECTPPSCSWTVTSTECINGQQTITRTPISGSTITGTCTPASENAVDCSQPQVLTVPCGNLGFELPFFDIIHFIASTLIIALIYFAFFATKKKK